MSKLNKLIKSIPLPLIYLLIISFFVWAIYKNIKDFDLLLHTIYQADVIILIYTLLLGLGNIAIFSLILRKVFSLISSRYDFPKLFEKTLSYLLINISTPIGVTGGSAYIVKYLTSLGITQIRAFFGIVISNLVINISYFIILAFTLLYISNSNDLLEYQEIAAILITLLNLAIVIPLLFIIILPRFSKNTAYFIVSIINSFTSFILRRNVINMDRINEYINEAISISNGFTHSIKAFIKMLPLSTTYHIINIGVLFLAFYSLGTVLDPFQAISLYGIIFLFTVVSPTPYGIGIVEGLAHSAAINMDIDPSVSLVAIILYRFAVLWLPSVIGLFTLKERNR